MRGIRPLGLLLTISVAMSSAVAVSGAAASPAAARSEIQGDSSSISYGASPGETNDVTVSYDSGSGEYTITDAGVATITSLNPSCTVNGNQATCAGSAVILVTMVLGDMDDRATIDASVQVGVQVEAQEGNDTITDNSPFPGSSTSQGQSLIGGPGNDAITFNSSAVSLNLYSSGLHGGDGNDTLTVTGPSSTLLIGGLGDDAIQGGGARDHIDGGSGAGPGFESNSGTDTIDGGGGPDQISAFDGDDTVAGGDGNDLIYAGGGNDVVHGGPGDEPTIYGGGGNDQIFGDNGDDTIQAEEGEDTIDGGAGNDLLYGAYESVNASDTINCGSDNDNVIEGPDDVVSADCEVVTMRIACPEGPDACEGTASVTGTTGTTASIADSALRGVATATTVVLGRKGFTIGSGRKALIRVRLDPTKVQKVLSGRESAPVVHKARWHKGDRRFRKKRHFSLHQ